MNVFYRGKGVAPGTLSNPAQVAYKLRSKLILSSRTLVVPDDCSVFECDIVSPGGGGGGGDPTPGGGGSGGCPGCALLDKKIIVTPGATLTIAIGAPGLGGNPGAGGLGGGAISVTDVAAVLIHIIPVYGGFSPWDISQGGNIAIPGGAAYASGSTGDGYVSFYLHPLRSSMPSGGGNLLSSPEQQLVLTGSGGGNLNNAGGASFFSFPTLASQSQYRAGSAGGSLGGGGGHGGFGPYGEGGCGGANGQPGQNGTGYGSGGGGGSGNAKGGDGAPGFLRIRYWSATEIV